MKAKWLINPFERIAGWQALTIGIVIMALTAVIGKLNQVAFDGALDAHVGATFSFPTAFAMQAIDFLSLSIVMWITGIIFSKSKVRVIDVAGTMALARTPMLLLTIICFLPVVPNSLFDFPRLTIFVIITIPLYIWMIALMYNAYSVSCHLKGSRAIILFIGALVVAEVVSKYIIFILLSGSFTNLPASGTGSAENVVVVTDSLTIRQKTEEIVKAFEHVDFNAITVYFDATMKKGLPASGLKMVWLQTNMTYGKFEKADLANLKESSTEKYEIVEVPFTFQKGKLNLRLVFDKNGAIGGLFLKPSE